MKKEFYNKLIIFVIVIFAVIFLSYGVISVFGKYMLNEIQYSYYNPYYEYEKDFNELAVKMENIKPISKTNINNRYYISLDNDSKYQYNLSEITLSNGKNIYDYMKNIGINTIFHLEDGVVDFRTEKFLLGVKGNEYYYYPNGWENYQSIDKKNIVKVLNKNWVIYNNY